MLESAFIRVHQGDPGNAIYDDHVILVDITARLVQADNGRDAEAAGEDGGMRGGAAIFGGEGDHAAVLQQYGIGRSQVMGQDDVAFQLVAGFLVPQRRLLHQYAQDAVDHVVYVILARTQVGIVHFIKHGDQGIALQLQRPLGVVMELPDQLFRFLQQGGVIQHQQVGIDEADDVRGGSRRDVFPDCAQLLSGVGDRVVQSFGLGRDLCLADAVFRDIHLVPFNDMHLAYGNAAGHPHTMQGDAHSCSPKRSVINVSTPAMACSSSAPEVMTSMSVPLEAASIMIPMMLLPLTLRPLWMI